MIPEREESRRASPRMRREIRKGDRDKETPQGGPAEVTRVRGMPSHPEENADLPGFAPESAHLLLQGVYGDFPHHNDRSHLDGGIADNAAWQRRWCRLAA